MELLVLRHGEAEPYRADDFTRELVAAGRAEVRAQLERQKARVGQPKVLVSPYIRARQTAAIAVEVLGLGEPEICEYLTPESDPRALVDYLYAREDKSLMLVSHQPLVSHLLDVLCGPADAHGMDTASLACVDCPVMAADMGQLRWLSHVS